MKIAVLSGKGGTGKTFISVNLAAAAGNSTYIDCDAEEPNGRLFFKPENVQSEQVYVKIPEFDLDKCTGCRKCANFCRFNALICIKNRPHIFENICHSCGACALVCPSGAICEKKRAVGNVEYGKHGKINAVTGVLNPGEESSVPVINAALRKGFEMSGKNGESGENGSGGDIIIDCPPGSACSVTESVSKADFCILAAEPTAFGLHNFRMVYKLVSLLGKKCCVVINKESEPYTPLDDFCAENNIPVLLRIPYDERLAALGANAEIAAEADEKYKAVFEKLLYEIKKEADA